MAENAIFHFPSSYRRNFESMVVSEVENKRTQMNVAAILVPVTLPMILEFTDFIESENGQLITILIVLFLIILSTIFFILADKLTLSYFSKLIDVGFKKQLVLFIEEIRETNHTLIKENPKNFRMKSLDEIESKIRVHSGSELDRYSYEDELQALDALDNLAGKMRSERFTLSDLQLFCSVENLIVIEDYSILDQLLELEKEINSQKSNLLARFYHDNNLGYFDYNRDLKETAADFISFVITGKSSNAERDEILNEAVDRWIENTSNVVWSPYVIYTDRMSVFICYEFMNGGSCYAAALMQDLCSNELGRKFEFYTSTEGPFLEACGNASQVGGEGVEISPEDERFGLDQRYDLATPPTNLFQNMTIQMGFDTKMCCNIKVGIDSPGRGAVVIREYFTLPNGYSKWAFFGEGGKASAKQDGLLALVKSSTSMKVAKIADLSSSPLFAKIFETSAKYSESERRESENDLETMKKVVLQNSYT